MIVYGTVTGASVGALFMGGIGAGLIYGPAYIVYRLWYAKKYNIPKGKKSTGREKWAATKDAAWALGVPVIIMGGIYPVSVRRRKLPVCRLCTRSSSACSSTARWT